MWINQVAGCLDEISRGCGSFPSWSEINRQRSCTEWLGVSSYVWGTQKTGVFRPEMAEIWLQEAWKRRRRIPDISVLAYNYLKTKLAPVICAIMSLISLKKILTFLKFWNQLVASVYAHLSRLVSPCCGMVAKKPLEVGWAGLVAVPGTPTVLQFLLGELSSQRRCRYFQCLSAPYAVSTLSYL